MESCLATLNTMDSKPYKKFLQDKLKEWYNLYAAVRPTPGRLSVASLGNGNNSADKDGAAARDEGLRGELGGTPVVVMNCYPPKSAAESGQRARAKMRFIYMISLLMIS